MQGPADNRFYWTAEATMPVNDWWQAATPARRKQFLKAVRTGQLEITALPFNNTPFMNAAQWQTMVHWLPDELWRQVRPRVAIQNDVNGFPRAGALALLDRGVSYLFTGINEDSGGVPFPRPAAFWWKMPDGRRLFVWLNIGYGSGFDFFEPGEWRRGPVPARGRHPLSAASRRGHAAHRRSLPCARPIGSAWNGLRHLERSGYRHELLTISITSQWRFRQRSAFSAAGRLRGGLEPPRPPAPPAADDGLRGHAAPGEGHGRNRAPSTPGEWTDWWANGTGFRASRSGRQPVRPNATWCGRRHRSGGR